MTQDFAKRDKKQAKRDIAKRDSLARARPPYGGNVTVSRVTDSQRDVTCSRDSALSRTITAGKVDEMPAPAGGPASHQDRTAAHREHLAKDPRFAAWASMQKVESA